MPNCIEKIAFRLAGEYGEVQGSQLLNDLVRNWPKFNIQRSLVFLFEKVQEIQIHARMG
jgi:hypothetical protein